MPKKVTGSAKQERAREVKITAWLKKPFEVSEFKNLIKKALE